MNKEHVVIGARGKEMLEPNKIHAIATSSREKGISINDHKGGMVKPEMMPSTTEAVGPHSESSILRCLSGK